MNGQFRPRAVRRCILLVEMDDGLQYGYQVAGDTVNATITFDPPEMDPRGPWWSDPYNDIGQRPHYGEITCRGVMTGMARMPSGAFTDEPEVQPRRAAVAPTVLELEGP